MRLRIENNKDALVQLITTYVSNVVTSRKVDLIVNGSKHTGVIKNVALDNGEHSFLCFAVGKNEVKIPLLEETKVTLGEELLMFETKNHTTVIEVEI